MALTSEATIGLLAAGGALYYLTKDGKTAPTGQAQVMAGKTPHSVWSPEQVADVKSKFEAIVGKTPEQQSQYMRTQMMQNMQNALILTGMVKPPAGAANHPSQSGMPQAVEDRVKKKLEDAWKTASGDAKVRACQAIKSQYPAQTANADCSKMASATFQALFAIAAAAAAGALCGPACSAVAVVGAAIVGPKFQELCEDAWAEIADLGKAIGNAVEDAYDWATGWI